MHSKAAKTSKLKYYAEVLASSSKFIPLFTAEEYAELSRDKMHKFKWQCKHCGSVFESRIVWGNAEHIRCLKCNPVLVGTSGFEKSIAETLASKLPPEFEVLNQAEEN